jgi:hypothetical protein
MNIIRKSLIAAACAAALVSTTNNLKAQGGGGGRGTFDPVQMKQDRLTSLREQMEIKDDTEWSAIEGKLSKAWDARANVMALNMRGGFGRGGQRRNNNGNADDQAQRPRRPQFGEPSPALEALQKAIEDKAPSAEVKTKLAAYRAEVKDRQAKFEAAQEDLRGVLTARQEAIATVNGLLQ